MLKNIETVDEFKIETIDLSKNLSKRLVEKPQQSTN